MPRYHGCWSVGAVVGAGLGALAAALGLRLTTHFAIAALDRLRRQHPARAAVLRRRPRARGGPRGGRRRAAVEEHVGSRAPAAQPPPGAHRRHHPVRLPARGFGRRLDRAVPHRRARPRRPRSPRSATACGPPRWRSRASPAPALIERLGRVRAIRVAGAVVLVGRASRRSRCPASTARCSASSLGRRGRAGVPRGDERRRRDTRAAPPTASRRCPRSGTAGSSSGRR